MSVCYTLHHFWDEEMGRLTTKVYTGMPDRFPVSRVVAFTVYNCGIQLSLCQNSSQTTPWRNTYLQGLHITSRKNITDTFQPQWLTKQVKSQAICCVENYTSTLSAYRKTNLETPEQLEQANDVWVVSFTVNTCVMQLPLCQSHYLEMYTNIPVSRPCDYTF